MIHFLKNLFNKKEPAKDYIKIDIDTTNGTAIISSNKYDITYCARRIVLYKLIHESKKQCPETDTLDLYEKSEGFFTISINDVQFNISPDCFRTFIVQASYLKNLVNLILNLQESIKYGYPEINIEGRAKGICEKFKDISDVE